jgi:hypothetical protein
MARKRAKRKRVACMLLGVDDKEEACRTAAEKP